MQKFAFISILLGACTHAQAPAPGPTPILLFDVNKGLWTQCWEKCGRGDKLFAVNAKECVCSQGRRIEHGLGPKAINVEAALPSPQEEEAPSKSIFEMLGIGVVE